MSILVPILMVKRLPSVLVFVCVISCQQKGVIAILRMGYMASIKPDPDWLIIKSFLAGNKNSFNELVNRHERSIYNLVYRMVGNSTDAADLTQEIFIHLYRKISSFRGESTFSTWLYRLAVNYSKDWLQKESRRVQTIEINETLLPDNGIGPSQLCEQREIQTLVQLAILELPEDQRLMVILHDLQGYDYKDIAGIVGVPVGTVKSRLARARLKLADKLAPYRNDMEKLTSK